MYNRLGLAASGSLQNVQQSNFSYQLNLVYCVVG